MSRLREIASRVVGVFGKGRQNVELDDELREHLALAEAEHLRRGLSAEEARRAAKRDFGGVEQHKEIYRERRGLPIIETFFQDLKFGARMLRKKPGFTAVALLTLAIGIGATAAIFSVVNSLLLRPLPFPASNSLVILRESIPKILPGKFPVSAPDIGDFRRMNHSFVDLGAFSNLTVDLAGEGTPERVFGSRTSAAVFRLLGVTPLLGRTFEEAEDQFGTSSVILSYDIWRTRYAGDPGVLGKKILVNRMPYEVIGVMPKGFEFPPNGLAYTGPADVWVPIAFTAPELSAQDRGDNFNFGVLARLKPGVSVAAANADVMTVANDIQEQFYPVELRDRSKAALEASVTGLAEEIVGGTKKLLLLLLGAAGVVMLIACANVANLLLARGAERKREIAVRVALGAGRGRLVRQLLAESGLLGFIGGALGLLAAYGGVKFLLELAATILPRVQEVSLDATVLAFTLTISVLSSVIFGVVPAFFAARTDLNEGLKEGGRSESTSRAHVRVRDAFVIAQIALALLLVTGSGLLIRSFLRVEEASPGFRTENTFGLSIVLPEAQYSKLPQVDQFFDRLAAGVQVMPGVQSFGISSQLPLGNGWTHTFTAEGHEAGQKNGVPVDYHTLIQGDYFQTLGIPLIRGRYFTSDELQGKGDAVIITEGMAKQYWPAEDPVGRRLKWGPANVAGPWLTIVGVVGDVKQGALDEATGPHTFEPYEHVCNSPESAPLCRSRFLLIRSALPPRNLVNDVRSVVKQIDPQQTTGRLHVVEQLVSSSIAPRRLSTWLLGIFGAAALLLAAIGVYGVISYAVSQRTQEFGVRLALGAQRGNILRMVLGKGLKLAAIGLLIGLGAALALTRLLESLLYEVKATDPVTFVSVAALLLGVALAACWIPALRATRIDPCQALRHE